jgi:hypothetical protein
MYAGRSGIEATLAAAGKPGERCEAQFYIAEWELTRSDHPAAIKRLSDAVEICPKNFIEYPAARAELKRLGQ